MQKETLESVDEGDTYKYTEFCPKSKRGRG